MAAHTVPMLAREDRAALFAALLRQSSQATLVVEAGYVVWTNDAFARRLGADSGEELVGRAFIDLFVGPSQAPLTRALREADAGRRQVVQGLQLVEKDGQRIVIDLALAPLRCNHRKYFIVTPKDTDETERNGEELILMEMVERTSDLILRLGPRGEIVYANATFARLLGLESHRVRGRLLLDFMPPSEAEDLRPRWAECFGSPSNGGKINVEWEGQLVAPDERKADISWTFTRHEGGAADQPLITGVGRDISERKQREFEQRRREKLESLGLLAGGIAHDFNNLLTGIMGNISFLELSLEPGCEASGPVTAALRAARRAKGLTSKLLTFAKGGEPVKRLVSLEPLVRETTEFALHGSSIACEFEATPDLPPLNVDPDQIGQVVQNLVINAVQAMPNGGLLSVQCASAWVAPSTDLPVASGRYVVVSVSDTGGGIPEQNFAKIFDPYFTTKATGSGLGLASSYSIVHNHGGCIQTQSTLGVGTTFRVYLPAATGQSQRQCDDPVAPRGNGERILLMDDDREILAVAQQILRRSGYLVDTSKTVNEAVDLYLQRLGSPPSFALAILDLTGVGSGGGREAARRILEADPTGRILFSSGYANSPPMTSAANDGACGLLSKPYTAAELARAVSNALAVVPVPRKAERKRLEGVASGDDLVKHAG